MAKHIGRPLEPIKPAPPRTGIRPNTTIRVWPDILHQGRVAAVIQKKTLGRWLEDAILEKIKRDQKVGESGSGKE